MTTLRTLRKRNPTTAQRVKRAMGVRKRVSGASSRPRLSIYRSAKHIYVQAIDDETGITIASASSMDKELRTNLTGLKKTEQAEKVGELLAKRLKDKGVDACVFDRNGFRYHGRVAAVANGARAAGLQF